MDPHATALEELRQEMRQRFDAIDRRFEVGDQRFDAIDRRFEVGDQRFDAIDRRFDAIDRRFDAIDRRFDAIDRRFDEVRTELRVLIESVQADVKLLLEHLAPTMTQVADHERRLTKLERRHPS